MNSEVTLTSTKDVIWSDNETFACKEPNSENTKNSTDFIHGGPVSYNIAEGLICGETVAIFSKIYSLEIIKLNS